MKVTKAAIPVVGFGTRGPCNQTLERTDLQTPVNIANPDERTILNLAEIIELTDSESRITHESRPRQNPESRKPDITKARTELDWDPSTGLQTGLKSTIEYFETII